MKKFIILSALICCAAGLFAADHLSVDAFRIRRNGCLSFAWDGFPVISRVNVTFNTAGGKTLAELQLQELDLQRLRTGETTDLAGELHGGLGSYKFSARMKADAAGTETIQLECSGTYSASPEEVSASMEVYLGKKLFFDAMKDKITPTPKELSVRSPLAKAEFVFQGVNAAWKLWNRHNAKWLDEHERSIIAVCGNSNSKTASKQYSMVFSLKLTPYPFTAELLELQYLQRLRAELGKCPAAASIPDRFMALDRDFGLLAKAPENECFDENIFRRLKTSLLNLAASTEFQATGRYNIPHIVPEPRQMELRKGTYIFKRNSAIVVPDNASERLLRTAGLLRSELKEYRGLDLPLRKASEQKGQSGGIFLAVISHGQKKADGEYRLEIRPDSIEIEGEDEQGVFYGTQSLVQSISKDASQCVTVNCMSVHDWPGVPLRSVSLEMARYPHARQFGDRLIRRWIARYKHNYLAMAIDAGNVLWKSHPEIPKASDEASWGKLKDALTPEQLREYAELASLYFLDIIPQIQVAGHSDNIVKAHPGLRDDPGDPSNTTLNFSKPETRKILCDLIDELVEGLQPKHYFNIGCDEMNSIGKNPESAGKNPVELFTGHVRFFRDYLRNKYGLRTMMWSDMLLNEKKWGWPGTKLGTEDAVETLPKDIVILYWNYMGRKEFPAYKHLHSKGFDVIGAPWFLPQCNYTMAVDGAVCGGLGYAATCWVITTRRNTMLTSLVVSDKSWNQEDKRTLDEIMAYDPDEHLQHSVMTPQPSEFSGVAASPIELSAVYNTTFQNVCPSSNLKGVNDLDILPAGKAVMGGTLYQLPPAGDNRLVVAVGADDGGLPVSVQIPVGDKARGLAFLHCCKREKGVLGRYRVIYADGTHRDAVLEGGYNIAPLKYNIADNELYFHGTRTRLHLIAESKRAWTAIAPTGEKMALQSFEWLNPHPEKEIKTVELTSTIPGDRILLLALSTLKAQH